MKINNLKQIKSLLLLVFLLTCIISCQITEKLTLSPYLIAYSSKESANREIYLSDAEGKSKIKVTSHTEGEGYPAESPDGKISLFMGNMIVIKHGLFTQ